jgi:hypothetical protein
MKTPLPMFDPREIILQTGQPDSRSDVMVRERFLSYVDLARCERTVELSILLLDVGVNDAADPLHGANGFLLYGPSLGRLVDLDGLMICRHCG